MARSGVGACGSSALARMIGNQRPQVPVILMSAYPELLAKDIASLASAVLCKPLEIAELRLECDRRSRVTAESR